MSLVVQKRWDKVRKFFLNWLTNCRRSTHSYNECLKLVISKVEWIFRFRFFFSRLLSYWLLLLRHHHWSLHMHLCHSWIGTHHWWFEWFLGLTHNIGNRSRVHCLFIFTHIFFGGDIRHERCPLIVI